MAEQNKSPKECSAFECSTSAVTVLSSDHGRMRRAQRLIEKRDLQAAKKYGTKVRAQPNRAGALTWRYEWGDIVYITDDTTQREITSWARPGAGLDVPFVCITDAMHREHNLNCLKIKNEFAWWTSHTVVVVDQSGSMRKSDVSGGATRSDAVWMTLAMDVVSKSIKSGTAKPSDVFSIVGMNARSTVLIDRQPTDWNLFNDIIRLLRSAEPVMDGCYLPALLQAENLLSMNPSGKCALSLLFLTDGGPSDPTVDCKPFDAFRQSLCSTIDALASRFGRRLTLSTVSFGPETENFTVLEDMASRPQEFGCLASFQHASLRPESLGLALSSLTTSLASTKTELTHLETSTQRVVRDVRRERRSDDDSSILTDDWAYYRVKEANVHRVQYDSYSGWKRVGLRRAVGIAMKEKYFGEGAERLVRKFREVDSQGHFLEPALVAKESRFVDDLKHQDKCRFHRTFCDTQKRAQRLAQVFNKRLGKLPGVTATTPRIAFLDCSVYMLDVKDGERLGVLVEKMLDPKEYKKWNSNAGYVEGKPMPEGLAPEDGQLDRVDEVSEKDESSEDSDTPGRSYYQIRDEDIPQAFSHFTYRKTGRTMLVCDLQGVLDKSISPPVFQFTDPVIHYRSRTGRKCVFGRTDKGTYGFHLFLKTHECSGLCHMLNRRWVREGEA